MAREAAATATAAAGDGGGGLGGGIGGGDGDGELARSTGSHTAAGPRPGGWLPPACSPHWAWSCAGGRWRGRKAVATPMRTSTPKLEASFFACI